MIDGLRTARAHRLGPASRALAGVAAAALVLAGCGSSRQASSTTSGPPPANTVPSGAANSLHVSPHRASTRSSITFGFTAPVASGVGDGHVIGYSLSVTGTPRSGCAGAREAAVPSAATGSTTTIRLGPAQLHRPWCPGRYAARVIELQRPHCTGTGPCPQYIRVVAIVARGSFQVSRS